MTDSQATSQQRAAFGAIIEQVEGLRRFLVQWNAKWGWYNLVGGKHEEELDRGDLRATAVRELEDELELRAGVDFEAAPEPALRYEFEAVSRSSGSLTRYYFAVFRIRLLKPLPELLEHLARNPANRWLTEREINDGVTSDGEPVSYLPRDILRLMGEIARED